MEPGGAAPPLRGPPRARASDADGGMLMPRGPVSEDVMAAISERATAIFSSHKHKVSGMLEPQQGPYALALVGAMLGLNQKQLDSELQLTARVGRRTLSYEEFMSACEAMVALHGALAQQQIKRLPNNDMSGALRAAFSLYVKLNVGGFMGGDQRMNSNQFTKMCQDAGMMEPNGPASMSTLQISWASCKATFGSTRLQYNQFLKVIGALAAELSGDVFLLVAGLGLQLPTVPPLRNGFRKPDAGEVNLPKPEMMQGVGAHVAAEEAYEKYVQEGRMPEGKRGDPLARAGASPIKARASTNGGVPNWVKAMQADQGGANPMTSGQDIRGIPVIETPDSDDESPRKPQPRKSVNPVPPDEPAIARAKASPMRPRGGKLPAMGAAEPQSPSMSTDSELLIRAAEGPSYSGGPGNRVDVLSAPVAVRPRGEAVRNGVHIEPDSPGQLEPSLLPAPPRARKAAMPPEGFREVVEQQAAAVKALESRVEEQKQREQELFERVQLLTEKLTDAQAAAAVTVQSGCPGAQLPDVPQGKGRTVVSGRCPLTDQVQRLTEQMAEVLARLSALESIRMQPKAPSEPPPKQRNPVGTRTPEFPDDPPVTAVAPTSPSWGPPGRHAAARVTEPDGPRVISPLEPVNATQGEWMSRLLLNLDKRVRVLEGAAGKGDADADGEALAEVLKQLRGMHTAPSPAPPAPPPPGSSAASPPETAFLKVDPNKRKMEKVGDAGDATPALVPTGDPELDRRLAALANEMRSKNATVGLLLDMLNQTRGEVAALAAQLNARGNSDSGPVVVGQRGAAPAVGTGQRNAIRVVDGGLVPPDAGPGLSPPMRRGEPAPSGVVPLEPHLENLAAEQHGLKRAVRELCAAIGVPPPPALAAAEPSPLPSPPAASPTRVEPTANEPWGQPGRKTIKEETQEVKRCVEGVQADVGELRKQVEQMRAGYGEWPQPLRAEAAGGPAAAAMMVMPGAAPVQAVTQGQGRNAVQVTVGAPNLAADTAGFAPGRRPQQPAGELSIAALPDAEVRNLKDELRRVQAFIDAALRTNIGNTNNLTNFINEHAPALQAVQPSKDGPTSVGGRNPITVTAGQLQQPQGALQPPAKHGQLPLQTEGTFDAGGLDPVEYQKLRDQVRTMAHFLGGPLEPTAASPPPAAPPPPGTSAVLSAEPDRVGMQAPWGAPGRGGGGRFGNGGTVVDGLSQVGNDVETLKKQVAQMGQAMKAAGVMNPAVEAAAVAAAVGGGAEAANVAVRQRNPINVTAGGAGADGTAGFAAPPQKIQPGQEGMPAALEADVGRLKDEVRTMKHFLGMAMPDGSGGVAAAAGPTGRGGAAEGGKAGQGASELWGRAGHTSRDVDVDPVKRAGGYANVGEMARDLDAVKRRQGELEEAMRAANIPLPAAAEQGGPAVRVVAAGAPPQRNPIMVSPGLVERPDAVGLRAPKRPLQPLHAIEGVPEPVLDHLGAMQDDLRRVTAFLGMRSVSTDPAAPPPPQAEPVAKSPVAAATPPGPQQPWGTPPGPRGDDKEGPKVDRLSDLVREVQDNKQRQEGVERVLMAMGAQIPWATDYPAAPGAQPVAVSHQEPSGQQQRQRNPIAVTAGGLQEGGATGFAAPARRPGAAVEAPEVAKAVAVAPAEGRNTGVEPWGAPGREPRQLGQEVKNLGEVVRDVDHNNRRMAQLEEALRAAGIPIPPPQQATAVAVAPAQEPAGQQQRQRNPIAVTAGGLQDGGATGFAAPGRKLLPSLEGLPEPAQLELARMADDLKRVQAFLGMSPAGVVPVAAAAPEVAKAVAVAPAEGRNTGVEPWGAPGREPRQPGQEVKNLGEVVRDVDHNNRRMAQLEEALRAAGIPIPPPQQATAVAVASGQEPAGQQQRQRNPIAVTAGGLQDGGATGFAPGRKMMALEGLPEPTKAELARMADDLKRVQAFLGMSPAGVVPVAAAAPEVAKAVAVAPAEGRNTGVEPWGAPGREPRQPGQEVKNLGEVVRDVDHNNRRMAQLEEALRAAGIPIPPPQQATAVAVAPGQEPAGQQQRQRNPIAVTAGGLQDGGATGFAAPGRKMMALEGLPEPTQAELARMADDLKRVQAFLGMSPAGVVPVAAAAPEVAKAVAVAPAEGRSTGVEPWGAPGREPRQPGQEVKNLGEVVRDVDHNNRRMAQLEEALRAAGIPIPPPQQATAVAVAPGQEPAGQRQRNAVSVWPGLGSEGAAGMAPPRKLAAMEGLPEPAQAELARMADDLKRVQAFLGMSPAGVVPVAAAAPEVAKAVAVAPAEGRSTGVEPWGAPGREPRQPGQEVKNLGDLVKEVDGYKQRTAALEEALRAAGIPVPRPAEAAATGVAGTGEQPGQGRQRNGVMVTAGGLAGPEQAGFAPPQRRGPAGAGEDAVSPELARMADDLKRVQAFLGMSPAGVVPVAAAAPEVAKAVAVAPAEGRNTGVEPWGAPGREPRQPGQEVKNLGDLVKDLDDNKQRVKQLEEALRSAGIPLPPPAAAGAVAPAEPQQPGGQRGRNLVAVSPGLVPPEGATGFAAPRRGPGSEAPPESLPARVDALQDDVKRVKAFLGMQDGAASPATGAGPDGAKEKGAAPAAADKGPWAGPGRDKGTAGGGEGVAKELEEVKQQLNDLDRALRGAGMGYMLPKDKDSGPTPVQRQTEPADKQRGGVAVTAGGLQRPTDAAGFPALTRKDGLPPIENPSFVDANDYGKLKDDVDKLKAFLGMDAAKTAPAAAAAAVAAAGPAAAAAGNEPWASKNLKDKADEVAAVSDVKGGGPAAAGGRNRNPIAVSPGMVDEGAKGFAPPDRKQAGEPPEGISNPVVVDGEDYKQLKKALEDLQAAVGQQGPAPAAADGKKPKSLKEDTDDIKKFVRAMGKDVGAMGNDMQALKKHLDDVEGSMNRALANLAAEMARLKTAPREEEPDSPEPKQEKRKLEAAGDNMADTINAMAALNAAQQQQLARATDDTRAEDIDALNEAMRQSENQLARLLAFLKQDVMDRFAVHEKTLIRMAKQIDFIQRMLKGEFDDQRDAAREAGSTLTVAAPDGSVVTSTTGGTGGEMELQAS
ncbi:hypothetical protein VOLCADRAFT_87941 [Volvox carteri f. nagariensis]|uniref:Uncharacterized protein n=1 Tax=Volvox carteri f. nagariensis TaxID=3068 RepID=D8TMM9_VOLCA|nr:uncharacterized protein VOLCADRAFT_87941 [Volvox carteri f. nagariensis]EFJ51151.1 hypothetical protein VOLCADRAFT_87941 [Volvox carteri f. nagariensis]|eukprot:XP_002947618.1 hypothetical protein VOLCADRAFT_87941 [Volvox carteri f. nagariensis]